MTRPDAKRFTDIDPKKTLAKLKKHFTTLDDQRRYRDGSPTNTGASTVVVTYQQLTEWIFLLNVLEDELKHWN